MTPWIVTILLSFAGVPATNTQELAVLPVSMEPDSPITALASQIRHQSGQQSVTTLSEREIQARLLWLPAGATAKTLSDAQVATQLAEAEKVLFGMETGVAVERLETLIKVLEEDVDLTPAKTKAVRRARLLVVQPLMLLGSPKESGRAETAEGKRARDHLMHILQVEPLFQLPPADYPPKMRLLMDYARQALSAAPTGGVSVQANPSGQVFMIEGQSFGTVPTRVTLPVGRYRAWIEKDGRRSLQRWIEVGNQERTLDIDFAVESALVPSQSRLAISPDQLTETFMARISGLLGKSSLALVHGVTQDGQNWAGIQIYDAGCGKVVRKGAIPLGQQGVNSLVRFASLGDGEIDVDTSRIGQAEVWLNGVQLVPTTVPLSLKALPTGEHRLLVKAGGKSAELTVTVESGQRSKLVAEDSGGQLALRIEKQSHGNTEPGHSPAESSGGAGRLWLVPVAGGVGVLLVGLAVLAAGVTAGLGGTAALALYPRSDDGKYQALSNETANQVAVRAGATVVAVAIGLAATLLGVVVQVAGLGLIGAGIFLR